jgi:hypothetical protein
MALLASLFGILGVIPSILKAIIEGVAPLLKALSEFVVWLIKAMWEGLTDILDNLKTVLTVVILVMSPVCYMKWEHYKEVKAIHADYRAKWQPKSTKKPSAVSKADQEKYKNFPDLDPSKLFKWW